MIFWDDTQYLTYSIFSAILLAMNSRDIVVGLVILVLVGGAIYFVRRPNTSIVPEETPIKTIEKKMEDTFKLEIPEDVDKVELKDVSKGLASGIATRKYENGKFEHTVLADLPDPENGRFYEGWLVKDGKTILTGKMRLAKGGYLLNFSSNKDYSDYKKVVVTLEGKDDQTPEEHILEGSFK